MPRPPRPHIGTSPAPTWLTRERTYRTLGSKNPYSGYQAYVDRGNDVRTMEFYSASCVIGIYGSREFRQETHDQKANHTAAEGLLEIVRDQPEMDEIVAVVAKIYNVTRKDVVMKKSGRQKKNEPRKLAIYCSQQLGGHSQQDIANYFSLAHRGSVSSTIKAVVVGLENGSMKDLIII